MPAHPSRSPRRAGVIPLRRTKNRYYSAIPLAGTRSRWTTKKRAAEDDANARARWKLIDARLESLGLKKGMKCPSSLGELLRLNQSKSPIPGDHVKGGPARQFTSVSTIPSAIPSSEPERKRPRTEREGETEMPGGSQVLDQSVSESLPSSADFSSRNRDVTLPIGFSSVGSGAGIGDPSTPIFPSPSSPSPRDPSHAATPIDASTDCSNDDATGNQGF